MNEPKLSSYAIGVLQRVKAAILKEPERYKHNQIVSDCGTMMCVAGHVYAVCALPMKYATMTEAGRHLGLSEKQRIELFNPLENGNQPIEGFKACGEIYEMYSGTDARKRAAIGALYIDAFIAKYSDPEPEVVAVDFQENEVFQSSRMVNRIASMFQNN